MTKAGHGSLPAEFLDRLKHIVPAEALEAVLAALGEEADPAFRVNRLRVDPGMALAALAEEGIPCRPAPAVFPDAWVVPAAARAALTRSRAVREGWIYLQNLSSMLPPLVLAPRPGEEVLDLCAAPGSKTTQMAVLMRNQGRIAAVEAVRARYHRLRANLERQGVTIVQTYLADGRGVGRRTPERFDRVLLDAPCSSEARLRPGCPDSWRTWSPRKIREQARKQVRLFQAAVEALRPGGRLVYSTCTFAPEENEAVVQQALERYGAVLRILPVALALPNRRPGLTEWQGRHFAPELAHAVRILPGKGMEAFFLCLVEKCASLERNGGRKGRRRPGPVHGRRRRRREIDQNFRPAQIQNFVVSVANLSAL